MKVIKEDIANLERALEDDKLNIVGSMPIVMADAVKESEKTQEKIDKDNEEKELELKLEYPFLGAVKQPTPTDTILEKTSLDESLFEDYADDVRKYSNMLVDLIDRELVDPKILQDLIYWYSEDDIKRFMEVNDLIDIEEEEEEIEECITQPLQEYRIKQEPEDLDLFTIVHDELAPFDTNIMKKTKFKDVPIIDRYNYEDIAVSYADDNDNIAVITDTVDQLDFAKKVADSYKIETIGPEKYGDKFKLTLIMPII